MGCGNSKVPPDASMKGCVTVVQSLVAFTKAREHDEPKKRAERQRGLWFSAVVKTAPPASEIHQQTFRDGRHHDTVVKYKDKFDPRVTAR